jgi:hypothetical protein
MAGKKARTKKPPPSPPQPPRIHEATLEPGASGAVVKGAAIDEAVAIARRKAGEDIVVCGNAVKATRRVALAVESAVGPCERQEPHVRLAGPLALPHFQQTDRSRKGHSFYETERRKAKGKS